MQSLKRRKGRGVKERQEKERERVERQKRERVMETIREVKLEQGKEKEKDRE